MLRVLCNENKIIYLGYEILIYNVIIKENQFKEKHYRNGTTRHLGITLGW